MDANDITLMIGSACLLGFLLWMARDELRR